MTEIDRLFTYHPPTPEKGQKYAAISEAKKAADLAIAEAIVVCVGDKVPRFQAVNDACKQLYTVIEEQCPGSADKAAALRCVRLARMAANEVIQKDLGPDSEHARQCRENLRAAGWQANASIALDTPRT